MKKQKFEINEPIEINGKVFNIKAEGTIMFWPGSYLDPPETEVDYESIKINNQDISFLDNNLFDILTVNLNPAIIDLVESKYSIYERV
jgi:hypothetical protein